MTYYQKEAVPQIVEHYLKTGRPQDAATFQSWASDQATKAAMATYARMLAAANAGDDAGFLTNAIDLYNDDNYFDDGFEVVRKGSKLNYDESGKMTGATLKFRDQSTGKTFERQFDADDLYELGARALSPEGVYDYYTKQRDAERDARAKEVEHQRRIELEAVKAQARAQQTPQARVQAAAKALADDPAFSLLTPEGKKDMILKQIEMEDAAAAALAGNVARPAARTGVPMWGGD